MTAADYYIHKSGDEWEAFERWENEGGRVQHSHDLSLDSIGENYLRRMEQAIPIGRLSQAIHLAQTLSKPTFDLSGNLLFLS